MRGLTLSICASLALFSAGCASDDVLRTPDGSPISTSTTRIAEVNLVAPERDYAQTCRPATTPDEGRPDVGRIVVTDPALLDAVCALGLGPKVVAVTAAPGSVAAYLGPQLTSVPAVGATPDPAAVQRADADIVLTTPATAASAAAFTGVETVTIKPGTWQDQFQAVADALGRNRAGTARLREFTNRSAALGRWSDAAHTWVSLVRFTPADTVIAGNDTFAAGVLAMIGAQRPAPQRVQKSFVVTDQNFADVDGDLIYVSFVGKDGQAHGEDVLLSDRWLDLGAPTWKRVLAVDDDVWYHGQGLAAAWLVFDDVKASLRDGSSQGS
ncbi:ABC transporter substrate-binding protein [Gordonia sp. ABSL1-1]|uniref:ABC transporter substrate-binding protein n=1 Tax=Gordonia sp. ABSL1-1 TaxID=3053923 RepID=UPI002573F22F|nr:ABC transporter substrate-binding protein [Gordonia sp. ABSL1-1]MDL9935638.1 ABC transporter substrate-binding protein [Gordonia sp. ABSL1-1]